MRVARPWPKHSGRLANAARAMGLLLLTARCAPAGRERDRTLVIGVVSGSHRLNPLFKPTTTDRSISDQLFDKLAEVGPARGVLGDDGFVPRLAERWEWSRDSTTLTMHLNPRARWHDGHPVRASDVRFSLSAYTDSLVGSRFAADLRSSVDSIAVLDSLAFAVKFHARRPENFYNLVTTLVPVPEHQLGRVRRDSLASLTAAGDIIGSGPYRLTRIEPQQRVEISATDFYYGERARIARVVWSESAQAADLIPRLVAGEVDFIENVPVADTLTLTRVQDLRLEPGAAFEIGFLQFNLFAGASQSPHPVLGNSAVRIAIEQSLDRALMVRSVFGSRARVPAGPFVRGQSAADTTLRQYTFDRDAAARALDALGWRRGADGIRQRQGVSLSFAVLYPAGSRTRERFAQLMQEQLRLAGIDVRFERLDDKTLGQQFMSRRFDALLNVLTLGLSPSGIQQVWSSGASRDGFNKGRYSSPVFDAHADSAARSTSLEVARAHYRAAYQRILDDAPAVWLYEPQQQAGVNQRVQTGPLRSDAWWATLPAWTLVAGARGSARTASAA